MMRRSSLLVSLALALAGCGSSNTSSGTVLVDVSADAPLSGVYYFSGTAIADDSAPIADFPLKGAPVTIDPTHHRSFGLIVPKKEGTSVTLDLNALDSGHNVVATGSGSATVHIGQTTTMHIVLSVGNLGDMGIPDDGGVGDGGVCDLGDGGSCGAPDLCSGTGCFLPNGADCSATGAVCQSALCVDNHCCSVASCPGTCQACGASGSCENVLGSDPDTCPAGNTCDGTGHCVALGALGATCQKGSDCSNGQCVDGHCCATANSCGTCSQCTGTGGTCVTAPANTACSDANGDTVCNNAGQCKKPQGTTCATNADCLTGYCTDGVCCNSNCTGQCQACNTALKGVCSPVNGKPVTGTNVNRSDCTGVGTACYGSCNGSSTICTYPAFDTPCGATCQPNSGGAYIAQMGCDSNGTCDESMGSKQCGSAQLPGTTATSKCLGNSCAPNCTTDTDCASGYYCSSSLASNGIAGTCVASHGNGYICTNEDCEASGCRFCGSGTSCQTSGQCCSSSCGDPQCTTVSGHSALQQYACDTTGTCSASTVACQCTSSPTAQCQPCTTDTDCQRNGYYCNQNGTCLAQIASGMACSADNCPLNQICTQCANGSQGTRCPAASSVCP